VAAVDFSADPFVLELSRASHAFDDKLGRLQPRAGSAAPALSTDGFDRLLFDALMPRQPLAHDDVTASAEAERHSQATGGSDLYPREPNAKGAESESESPGATDPTKGETPQLARRCAVSASASAARRCLPVAQRRRHRPDTLKETKRDYRSQLSTKPALQLRASCRVRKVRRSSRYRWRPAVLQAAQQPT
jgi:hypothetical protein